MQFVSYNIVEHAFHPFVGVLGRCPDVLAFTVLPELRSTNPSDRIAILVDIDEDFSIAPLLGPFQVFHAEEAAFPVGLLTQLGSTV